MEWCFVKSSKGKDQLVINRMIYRLDRKRDDNVYYKCIEQGCGGRAVYRSLTNQAEATKNHTTNHDGHSTLLARKEFQEKFNAAVLRDPVRPVPNLFNETRRDFANTAVNNYTEEDISQSLPTLKSVSSSAYRQRAKTLPKLPQTANEINITGVWGETNDGRAFLQGHEGETNKILIFATDAFLRKLCQANVVFMDGTFKAAPKFFAQIYTLHIFWMDIMVPVVYALLPNKNTNTYIRMFQLIKEATERLHVEFNPPSFQIDYEMGVISAIRSVFGTSTTIKGCLFHFGQSIWRKTQRLGLKEQYETNDDVKKLVRRLCGLALVPVNSINECWMEIFENYPNVNGIEQLLNYFTETYLDEIGCLFDRSMWNHYSTEHTRTINHLEGWHFALNRCVFRPKPNIYAIIREIKNQQQNFELDLRPAARGDRVRSQSLKFKRLEDRLNICKGRLEHGEISTMEYLDQIKYHIHLEDREQPNAQQ